MEHEPQGCKDCLLWAPITAEEGTGLPKIPTKRPGWGICKNKDLQQVRIHGELQTFEQHWCTSFVERPVTPAVPPELKPTVQ